MVSSRNSGTGPSPRRRSGRSLGVKPSLRTGSCLLAKPVILFRPACLGALQGFSMAKPLRTDNPNPPNMQFAHFGVLNDGSQSKASLFTSITVNIVIAVVVCILGAAAKKQMDHMRLTHLTEPIPLKKTEPEPVKPKVIPKPLPKPPVLKVEAPKIK